MRLQRTPGGLGKSDTVLGKLQETVLNKLDPVLDWFYPRHCYHCGKPLKTDGHPYLCQRCFPELTASRVTGNCTGSA
ncbi:MAG: double zinc ribbon domain-containing protein [Candidatus Brocadiia bacterium]